MRVIVPRDDLGGRSILGLAGIEMGSVGSSPGGERPAAASVSFGGLLKSALSLNAALFAYLPQIDVTTLPTPRHGGSTNAPRSYRGVRLYDLLERAGILLDDAVHEDFLNKIIVAKSTDGYASVIAGGEIEPRFMNGNVVIAREHDTNGESFRLVVPFDHSIGRSVKSLASIELLPAGEDG